MTLRFYHVILMDVFPPQQATDAFFFCQQMRRLRNLLWLDDPSGVLDWSAKAI